MSPHRILVVMPLAEMRGGVERMLLNLLRANAVGQQAEYLVAFLEDGPMVELVRTLGVRAEVIAAGRLRRPVRYVRTVRRLTQLMRRERIGAVLSWAAKGHLYAGPAARMAGIPAAWYVHSLPNGHWMDRVVTAVPADLVLCCGRSAELAQQTIRPRRPTRTTYIAVDLSDFDPSRLPDPAEARRLLGLGADGPLVTMVARLQHWKGVHVFVDAAARLLATHPDVRFVVVGGPHWAEPDYPGQVQRQAVENGLADRILFAGLQSNVPLWMQAADVLVHASFDEPTGTVILEGMALGKPVVAARTDGPMEFVEDGENGRLADPGNAEELATTLAELLDDIEQRRRLGLAARDRARQFGADRLAAGVGGAMIELVNRRRVDAV